MPWRPPAGCDGNMPDAPNTLPLLRLGRLALDPGLRALQPGHDASGLVRDDYYDWPKAARELAAGKDHIDFVVIMGFRVDLRLKVEGEVFLCVVEARPPAHSVYCFESRGRDEPGTRFFRYAGLRPRV